MTSIPVASDAPVMSSVSHCENELQKLDELFSHESDEIRIQPIYLLFSQIQSYFFLWGHNSCFYGAGRFHRARHVQTISPSSSTKAIPSQGDYVRRGGEL